MHDKQHTLRRFQVGLEVGLGSVCRIVRDGYHSSPRLTFNAYSPPQQHPKPRDDWAPGRREIVCRTFTCHEHASMSSHGHLQFHMKNFTTSDDAAKRFAPAFAGGPA